MYEVLRDLEADIWYNVWVRIDTALNHYEVWVNDATGASASPADHLAAPDGDQTFHFRTGDASELRAFFIKTSGGSSGFGPVYFDDLYLESTANLSLCNPTNLVLGDCNCDGAVNLADLGILLASFGLCSADPGFASNADVNGDGCVDLRDLALLLAAYGT